jgi:hypothetical protein
MIDLFSCVCRAEASKRMATIQAQKEKEDDISSLADGAH